MSRLEYDDAGSSFFGIAVGVSFLVPFTYHVASGALETLKGDANAGASSGGKKHAARTELERENLKRMQREKGTKALMTRGFYTKLAVIVVGWLFVAYLYSGTSTGGDIASFDPWEVLGLDEGTVGDPAWEKKIKSAYRKLSFKHHPDRHVNSPADIKLEAEQVLAKVMQAHEILTSEDRYRNFKTTGSADGSRNMEVSIGLPKFLMNKRNHNVILVFYLVILCVVTPITVGWWYFSSTLYGDRLILNDTYGVYALWLDKFLALDHYPEVLALSAEFRTLPPRDPAEEAIITSLRDELRKEGRMPADYAKKTRSDRMMDKWPGCSRANVLIYAYLNRQTETLTPGLFEDLEFILKKSILLIPAINETVGYLRLVTPLKRASKFEQYMSQALWVKDHPFQQLPHVTAEDAERAQGKAGSMNKLLGESPEGKEALELLQKDMGTNEKADFEATAKLLPKVSVRVTIGCVASEEKDGSLVFEPESCEGDVLTAEVKIERNHNVGPVHAPYLPYSKEEEWAVIFCKEGEKGVLMQQTLKGHTQVLREKFVFPSKNFIKPGTHRFDFHVMPLSYVGFDQLVIEKVHLEPEGTVAPIQLHPEDLALDNELSILEVLWHKAISPVVFRWCSGGCPDARLLGGITRRTDLLGDLPGAKEGWLGQEQGFSLL